MTSRFRNFLLMVAVSLAMWAAMIYGVILLMG